MGGDASRSQDVDAKGSPRPAWRVCRVIQRKKGTSKPRHEPHTRQLWVKVVASRLNRLAIRILELLGMSCHNIAVTLASSSHSTRAWAEIRPRDVVLQRLA